MRVVAVWGDLVGYLRVAEPATLPALDAELPMFADGRVGRNVGGAVHAVHAVDTSERDATFEWAAVGKLGHVRHFQVSMLHELSSHLEVITMLLWCYPSLLYKCYVLTVRTHSPPFAR
jgi:hypothetical protein